MQLTMRAEPVAEGVYSRITRAVAELRSKTKHAPTLATVLVGEDPASRIYVKKKGEMSVKLGMGHRDRKLAATVSQDELCRVIKELNEDPEVDGILVQSPLPKHIDSSLVYDLIDPTKDVDCFSAHNVGLLTQGRARLKPCTPAGIMEMLRHYGIDPAGKNALIVGRSDIVGKPMALLLMQAHATITVAHSRTKDLAEIVRRAELVVAAIGKPKFLHADLPWQKDCVVVDVGINRTSDGKVIGDVDFAGVSPKVAAITPVPGGVGPMTIAMLMENTTRAAFARKGIEHG
jgi:methylenetetrahydrofolate dehydrogenase (NADP+)/methenyltetrahydrofolate cyclohydrolase